MYVFFIFSVSKIQQAIYKSIACIFRRLKHDSQVVEKEQQATINYWFNFPPVQYFVTWTILSSCKMIWFYFEIRCPSKSGVVVVSHKDLLFSFPLDSYKTITTSGAFWIFTIFLKTGYK